jgi:hypothetical protein
MTRHQHHTTANVALAAPSPAWLNIDITLWLSRHGRDNTNMIQHRHLVAAKSPWQGQRQHDSASTSRYGQRRLDSIIVSMTQYQYRTAVKSPQQHHYHHDSGAWHLLPRLAIRLGGSPPIKLRGLRGTTLTDSPTQVHFYLYRRSQIGASASSPQWYGTLCQTS